MSHNIQTKYRKHLYLFRISVTDSFSVDFTLTVERGGRSAVLPDWAVFEDQTVLPDWATFWGRSDRVARLGYLLRTFRQCCQIGLPFEDVQTVLPDRATFWGRSDSAARLGYFLRTFSSVVTTSVTSTSAISIVVISRKKAADTGSLLTHIICLALGLLSMKQMERNCIISRVEWLSAAYLIV